MEETQNLEGSPGSAITKVFDLFIGTTGLTSEEDYDKWF